ncbi:16S rRNA (adenine(1518)-N(6)/adenine(1519)-N(6))-dimethyltransferase RsmA [Halocella sp. SP3-1]|uniref:16S rRNA (adenine(1518)-N(6)/adenine(1519)-N(6))- dimethyltransferase RsmA n=1 Tax=Halocella sp. SP3-1 TaxID=2382161 RepID=UPI000F754D2F|nr:16S rRNA (adenine(1518)-N(6)/adenine(1519)-N(6))-dimethyltransferase RsmA [Halocella sp. SP3-1]AZO93240.1 16S rRNA (adenine(1518)-N(6)/adenine(1519)-N(6))-dimethyltransferase RsmA [Halocella sp. SP3-1]
MIDIIASPDKTREILKENKIRLSKGLGQNFLIDRKIVDIIIETATLTANDSVIEIGPGIGSLTQGILERLSSGSLMAIEKDSRLIKVLTAQFSGYNNLDLINKDVLDIEWHSFFREKKLKDGEVKVLANLPYYITTPIIMNLLESNVLFKQLIFMVQREVAERMAASPGGKEYGVLSIAVQFFARVEIVHEVSPSVFIPRPDVYSTVITLYPHQKPPVEVVDRQFFFQVVRAIFQQRRKNIKNGLSKAAKLNFTREEVVSSLAEVGIDPRIRGEKLSISVLAKLSNSLWEKINK